MQKLLIQSIFLLNLFLYSSTYSIDVKNWLTKGTVSAVAILVTTIAALPRVVMTIEENLTSLKKIKYGEKITNVLLCFTAMGVTLGTTVFSIKSVDAIQKIIKQDNIGQDFSGKYFR